MRSLYVLLLLGLATCLNAANDAFEAGDDIVENAGKTNIEQFFSTKNLTKSADHKDVDLSTLLYTPDGEKPSEFYATAVKNFKNYAPKARTLSLYGGHVFYPEQSSVDVVKKEIKYTKEVLQALMKALKDENIRVMSSLMTVVFVVDDKTQQESKFEKTVGETFGKDSIVDDSNHDGLELLFRMEQMDMHLYFVFIHALDTIKKTKLPFGRSSYVQSTSDYLQPIYGELEDESKKRIQQNKTTLFTPGVKRLNKAGELHLEEFYDEKFQDSNVKDLKPSDTLKQLVLSLGVPPTTDNVEPAKFYKQAVENMKKRAPKLKNVRLDGGYSYNPEKSSADDLKSEITYFKNNLEGALSALKESGLNVSSLKLKVYWLSNKKDAEESGYPELLEKAFGYKPDEADVDSGKVLMTFKMHDVDCNVELNFYDKPMSELPKGRQNYYEALKVHVQSQEKSGKHETEDKAEAKGLDTEDKQKEKEKGKESGEKQASPAAEHKEVVTEKKVVPVEEKKVTATKDKSTEDKKDKSSEEKHDKSSEEKKSAEKKD